MPKNRKSEFVDSLPLTSVSRLDRHFLRTLSNGKSHAKLILPVFRLSARINPNFVRFKHQNQIGAMILENRFSKNQANNLACLSLVNSSSSIKRVGGWKGVVSSRCRSSNEASSKSLFLEQKSCLISRKIPLGTYHRKNGCFSDSTLGVTLSDIRYTLHSCVCSRTSVRSLFYVFGAVKHENLLDKKKSQIKGTFHTNLYQGLIEFSKSCNFSSGGTP